MSKITEAGTHLRPVQKVMGIEQEKSNALLPQTWVVRGYTNVSCVCVDPFTSFSSTADTISGQVSFIFVCVYTQYKLANVYTNASVYCMYTQQHIYEMKLSFISLSVLFVSFN